LVWRSIEGRKSKGKGSVCVGCEEPRDVAPTTATTTHEQVPVGLELGGLFVDNDRGVDERGGCTATSTRKTWKEGKGSSSEKVCVCTLCSKRRYEQV